MGGDLFVCSHQVDLGEDRTTENLMGVIMDIMDRIAVGGGPSVECSVVTAEMPTVIIYGHDV
jgi:hypothetical protein